MSGILLVAGYSWCTTMAGVVAAATCAAAGAAPLLLLLLAGADVSPSTVKSTLEMRQHKLRW